VAGDYQTEYSSMKFELSTLGSYINLCCVGPLLRKRWRQVALLTRARTGIGLLLPVFSLAGVVSRGDWLSPSALPPVGR